MAPTRGNWDARPPGWSPSPTARWPRAPPRWTSRCGCRGLPRRMSSPPTSRHGRRCWPPPGACRPLPHGSRRSLLRTGREPPDHRTPRTHGDRTIPRRGRSLPGEADRAPRWAGAGDRPDPDPAGLVRVSRLSPRRAGRGRRRARLELSLHLPLVPAAAAHRDGGDRTARSLAFAMPAWLRTRRSGREGGRQAARQDRPSLAEPGRVPDRRFDTEVAARLRGLERVGLSAVVADTLGLALAKEHSAADWSKRPLPQRG